MAGGAVVNHRMSADGCVLLSPSSASLQQLLNVRSRDEELHDIKYNDAKSVIMIFRTNADKRLVFPDLKLSGHVFRTCSQPGSVVRYIYKLML